MFINFNCSPVKTSLFALVATFGALSVSAQEQATLAPAQAVLFNQLVENGDEALLTYYQENDFAPIWSGRNTSRLLSLITALESADRHGLPVSAYDIDGLELAWAGADGTLSDAELEIKAAEVYIQFATDLTSGILEPHDVLDEINIYPRRPETGALLAVAAANPGNAALFDALEPVTPAYNALQAELARLQVLVGNGSWGPRISDGRTLRPGHSGSRVLAMRQRLNALGYEGTDGVSNVYDADLVLAMQAFQSDKALDADGIVGPKTMLALNSDPTEQMRQVIVNLERRRWLNYDLGDRHIFVNQASFMAYVVDFGLPTLSTRVVVGKTQSKYRTPEFIDEMTHMVVNPSWNVPQSIAAQEYLPQLLNDPSVLARQNIVMQVRGSGAVVDARLVDLSQYTVNNFPFVLRQRPGAGNALGKVKFMFPNRYNIYLHDTPSKSLFNRDTRTYSHGCVRVQRPFDLAHVLLAPQESDPAAAFQAYLNTGRETTVNLETPIPVYLTYQSVFIDESGELAYRVDVYGRDTIVFDALAAEGVSLTQVQG
ncbi:MAG: L,D-transpeptidase family protein [Rhodobacteraceae bacterium]|nr:L,D-transpeptidase family protein [Paracoccaceae bacterium]